MQTMISVAAFSVASGLYHYTNYRELFHSKEFNFYLLLVSLSAWIAIEYSGLHKMSREDRYHEIFFRYLKVTGISSGLIFTARYHLDTRWIDLGSLTLFAGINMVLLYGFKAFFYRFMQLMRRKGYNTRQLLVVADNSSSDFVEELMQTKDWGYRIQALVTDNKEVRERYQDRLKVFDSSTSLTKLMNEMVIDELFYARSKINYKEINPLMGACAERGIVFRLRPIMLERYGLKAAYTIFNDNPLYVFRNIPNNYLGMKIKRSMDILVSLGALIIASPVLLAIAIAIKLDDGGPVFFLQQRVGLFGRRFTCLKFRTMVTNAEALKTSLMDQNEQDGPVFKIRYDPRITRVGRFLRKYSLDEFPQFLNVLNGDMSVVGPRPPLPDEVNQYKKSQNRRLSVKPGITCIWQVSSRNNVDFDSWVKQDMEYIDNWSLKLDLILILKTFKVMIQGTGM
jgi:exopolysaccharide biosynthesis polyprenyl glycosylphosphotransferase